MATYKRWLALTVQKKILQPVQLGKIHKVNLHQHYHILLTNDQHSPRLQITYRVSTEQLFIVDVPLQWAHHIHGRRRGGRSKNPNRLFIYRDSIVYCTSKVNELEEVSNE